MKTYWLEGGIGKHAMFTALIPKLAEREPGGKIGVLSAYPEVFEGHPLVKKSWGLNDFMQDPKFVVEQELVNFEPYKSNFVFDKDKHLLYFWAKGLGIDYDPDALPNLRTKGVMKIDAKKAAKGLGDFILLQFTGGQSPLEMQNPHGPAPYGQNPMIQQRNYPWEMVEELVAKIKAKYPNLKLVWYSLPNEHPEIEGVERIQLPSMAYVELLKYSKTFIGIDSSLAHFAAGVNKPGIVLWGGISSPEFGWKLHTNMTNYDGKYGYGSDFNPENPDYIRVPTDSIMEELDKKLKDADYEA